MGAETQTVPVQGKIFVTSGTSRDDPCDQTKICCQGSSKFLGKICEICNGKNPDYGKSGIPIIVDNGPPEIAKVRGRY
ncbi:hypothetical protein HGM15179_010060 [Zosterops borbonicus]|uniref:Uncharacterized protein n=1 Tax=Zosterops borbonicus TaxID=364589 RepID=A0A8K1GE54_9PASS|nr:hypothetical protein HGM15179_010060 [Zosterops borbonicus]